jgi:serine/threonine protein phosphatase 1
MRNLIIGDIHGMYDRMISALSSSGFNPEEDNLYAVGDFCDRGPEPIKVLDYLMSLPHFFPVAGNHDMWLYGYLCGFGPESIWLDPRNGGMATYSVFKDLDETRKTQIRDWYGSLPFIRTTEKFIILHAGPPSSFDYLESITLAKAFKIRRLIRKYPSYVHDAVWDRDYIRAAINDCGEPVKTDKTIICGHTPLEKVFHSDKYHITCIDTGSFVEEGCITVMDMDTGELSTGK